MCRYSPFLTNAINKTFLNNYFSKELKKEKIIPVYKGELQKRKTTDLVAYCSTCQRFSKD